MLLFSFLHNKKLSQNSQFIPFKGIILSFIIKNNKNVANKIYFNIYDI